MTSPSTSRDRVETGAQASGGNDVVDAGKPREASQDATEEAALALKRAERIKGAETNMMEVANRARDESNPPTGEDIKKALDRFHAAADATPRPASHAADDRGPQLPPATAVAGSKRPSDPVARRFTREDVSAPPEERHRDDNAATMDVDDDDAFAGEHPVATRAVYNRASAIIQAVIQDGGLNRHTWPGSNDDATRAWLMLRFMLRIITPRVPKDGVQSFTPEEVAELTKQQNAFLDRDDVGSVNGAPLATFAAVSSGLTFVHTHPLPSDKNMVEKEKDIDATRTTGVMEGEDGKLVETARVTLRVAEDITGQTKFKPNQGNTFEFSRLNKKQHAEETGGKKYRGHSDAAEIVADTGGHVSIKAQLRNEKVGDMVFVGEDARKQFLDVIAREMSDLKIILFGESTAQLAFPGMGMHAFSWMKPESTAFGIMFCETTGVWRNFMCVHGYGTLNGYTSNSKGEKGMANNMRVLIRIADWFHYMYMEPICDNIMDSAIFRRHMEAMAEYVVEEENKIQHCFANNVPYFSPPFLMSSKGGEKSAEARRALPATGPYAGVVMENGKVCKDALQEGGKEMAEALRAQPATGEYAGVEMKNGEECKDALQQSGKEMVEARRAQPATGEHAGVVMNNGKVCKDALQQGGKKLGEEYGVGRRMLQKFPFVRLRVSRTLNDKLDVIALLDGSIEETRKPWARVCIQKKGNNQKPYAAMLEKFVEEQKKKQFKHAADLPQQNLSFSFEPETLLEDIATSLVACSAENPVEVVRRSRYGSGRLLTSDQNANWKFEVIRYVPAHERNAEVVKDEKSTAVKVAKAENSKSKKG